MVKMTCSVDQEDQYEGLWGNCRGEILVLVIAIKVAVDFCAAGWLSESFIYMCDFGFCSDSDNRAIRKKSKWRVIRGINIQEIITCCLGTVVLSHLRYSGVNSRLAAGEHVHLIKFLTDPSLFLPCLMP